MSNLEHAFENAVFAIRRGKTYEEWLLYEKKTNLNPKYSFVSADPEEIWELAQYAIYSELFKKRE